MLMELEMLEVDVDKLIDAVDGREETIEELEELFSQIDRSVDLSVSMHSTYLKLIVEEANEAVRLFIVGSNGSVDDIARNPPEVVKQDDPKLSLLVC
ncbi:hypothetical protein AC578_3971 [Pseudocercospora eumusae]|uniref:Uncharacterized protein n=1 Tax=Pseudocercospora eumusae TaxID=321146 RepID=A0A139HLP4_9PEZI|nr:hypothetical protein AC578_3971 [Pseudocercospora eumusae]